MAIRGSSYNDINVDTPLNNVSAATCASLSNKKGKTTKPEAEEVDTCSSFVGNTQNSNVKDVYYFANKLSKSFLDRNKCDGVKCQKLEDFNKEKKYKTIVQSDTSRDCMDATEFNKIFTNTSKSNLYKTRYKQLYKTCKRSKSKSRNVTYKRIPARNKPSIITSNNPDLYQSFITKVNKDSEIIPKSD